MVGGQFASPPSPPPHTHAVCTPARTSQSRMEVDWPPVDEREEGAAGALVGMGGGGGSGSGDFPMQPPDGQMQISLWGYQGVPPRLILSDAPVSGACWCV